MQIHLADTFNAVVDEIHLPAAAHFAFYGIADNHVIIFDYVRLHREAFLRRSLYYTHIARADQRHMQCARYRRGAQRQYVDIFADTINLFFLFYAEALFFIDN